MAAPTFISEREFDGLLAAAVDAASDAGAKLSATTATAAAASSTIDNFILAVGDNQNAAEGVETLLLNSSFGLGEERVRSVGGSCEICLL